jgi:hypothetical protein
MPCRRWCSPVYQADHRQVARWMGSTDIWSASLCFMCRDFDHGGGQRVPTLHQHGYCLLCAHAESRLIWLLQVPGGTLIGCLGNASGGSLHGLSPTPPLRDPRRTPTPGLEQAFVPIVPPAPAPDRPPQPPPLPLPAMPMLHLPYEQVTQYLFHLPIESACWHLILKADVPWHLHLNLGTV